MGIQLKFHILSEREYLETEQDIDRRCREFGFTDEDVVKVGRQFWSIFIAFLCQKHKSCGRLRQKDGRRTILTEKVGEAVTRKNMTSSMAWFSDARARAILHTKITVRGIPVRGMDELRNIFGNMGRRSGPS